MWTSAEKLDNDRLIVAVWGPPKTGKTTFALTAPGPIYFHNFDWGLEHHLGKLADKKVYVASYLSVGPELTADEAKDMLKAFERDYAAALKAGEGTIVIDTATQLWQITSKVFLEDIKAKRRDGNIYPFDYANANAYFQNLINQVKNTKMNMVLIQRAKAKYNASGNDTGEMDMQGNNQVGYLAQVVLALRKEEGQHRGIITDCWNSTALEGVDLANPTFDGLKSLIDSV